MRRTLLLLAAVLAASTTGCDLFRSTEPFAPPCKRGAPILRTYPHSATVDTVGYLTIATFYCDPRKPLVP